MPTPLLGIGEDKFMEYVNNKCSQNILYSLLEVSGLLFDIRRGRKLCVSGCYPVSKY